jgi:membrane-associated protease RseP (regulator of RpoE activity)
MLGSAVIRTTRRPLAALAPFSLVLLISVTATAAAGYAVSVDDDGDVAYVSTAGVEERSAYLGVQLEEEIEHSEGGARVTKVVEHSPADKAGLEEGDIIVGFDGQVIRGPVALTTQIHAKQAGDHVSIRVFRDGKKMNIEAELADRSERWSVYTPYGLGQTYSFVTPELSEEIQEQLQEKLKSIDPEALRMKIETGLDRAFVCPDGDCKLYGIGVWGGRARLGVQLVETTPELREHLGGSRESGVLVSKVAAGTPAENAGIGVGDLIVNVGGDEISSIADLRRALATREGETFDVEVIRDGVPTRFSVTLPAVEEDLPGPRAGLPIRVLPLPPAPPAPPAARRGIRLEPPLPDLPRIAPSSPALPAPPAPPARPIRVRPDHVV